MKLYPFAKAFQPLPYPARFVYYNTGGVNVLRSLHGGVWGKVIIGLAPSATEWDSRFWLGRPERIVQGVPPLPSATLAPPVKVRLRHGLPDSTGFRIRYESRQTQRHSSR